MSTLTWARNTGVLFAALLLINTLGVGKAAACKCRPPTVESSYNKSTDVVTVEIVKTQTARTTRTYVARVLRTFKGCLEQGEMIVLTTPSSSATCGAQLSARRHLINGTASGQQAGLPAFSINSCDYNLAVAALTEHDREFLNQRQVCCGADCTCADGTAPVSCFADPCAVAPACSEGACQANYCGGCNAEHYDANGYAVCGTPAPPSEPVCPTSCHPTGCSGQICAAQDVITTCEYRPEYACYQDPTITVCGCVDGACAWSQTDELAKCLAAVGGI